MQYAADCFQTNASWVVTMQLIVQRHRAAFLSSARVLERSIKANQSSCKLTGSIITAAVKLGSQHDNVWSLRHSAWLLRHVTHTSQRPITASHSRITTPLRNRVWCVTMPDFCILLISTYVTAEHILARSCEKPVRITIQRTLELWY